MKFASAGFQNKHICLLLVDALILKGLQCDGSRAAAEKRACPSGGAHLKRGSDPRRPRGLQTRARRWDALLQERQIQRRFGRKTQNWFRQSKFDWFILIESWVFCSLCARAAGAPQMRGSRAITGRKTTKKCLIFFFWFEFLALNSKNGDRDGLLEILEFAH